MAHGTSTLIELGIPKVIQGEDWDWETSSLMKIEVG